MNNLKYLNTPSSAASIQFIHCPLTVSILLFHSSVSQEEKDSDSSKETLDDLFPDDQDDQAPGSKCAAFLLLFTRRVFSPGPKYEHGYHRCDVSAAVVM